METIDTDTKNIENKIKDIIRYIGDNPEREGLLETPKRVVKSYEKLFGGYKKNPESILKTFTSDNNEMIILKNIEFYSMCEHHIIPFFGKISIGYIPNGKIIGVSKLARLVEIYSRRLQIQERLVEQIANSLVKYLNPLGVMVTAEAKHLCMVARGVEKQNSIMVTNAIRGRFEKQEVRDEFLAMVKS